MPRKAGQSPQPDAPAKGLKDRLGNDRLAQKALAAVKDRAPDDQLALAFLTKLAENSATALKDVLRDRAAGSDLIFCLGSSALIATQLSLAGPASAEPFLHPPAHPTVPTLAPTPPPPLTTHPPHSHPPA